MGNPRLYRNLGLAKYGLTQYREVWQSRDLPTFPSDALDVGFGRKGWWDPSVIRSAQALGAVYWQPIFGFLRSRGSSNEAQGFFNYLFEREFLKNIEPNSGRFRNFLLVSLRRWLKDEQ